MKKSILLLLGGFTVLFLMSIFSCDKCGPFPNKWKVVGMAWFNYKAVYSDTAQTKLTLSDIENDSVYYANYAILLAPEQEAFIAQLEDKWNFNMFPTANACDPVLPSTDERIDSIIIVSSTDFDAEHPAGSDLSELFDIVILDHSNGIHFEKYPLTDYIASNPLVPDTELVLILREQPEVAAFFEFNVQYYQTGVDNSFFEYDSESIFIKKVD